MHTDYGLPERAFFQKSQTFGLGQTNWANTFWDILGIFGQTTAPILALSPLPMVLSMWLFFQQKTLVFRPKTYKSQLIPNMISAVKNLENSHHTSVVVAYAQGKLY